MLSKQFRYFIFIYLFTMYICVRSSLVFAQITQISGEFLNANTNKTTDKNRLRFESRTQQLENKSLN